MDKSLDKNNSQKGKSSNYQLEHLKKTAWVYKGAAFLILLVGIRSVFLASDEESMDFIGFATIAAIAIEFFLLWMYANSVTKSGIEEDEEEYEINLDTSKLENSINDLKTNVVDSITKLDRTDELISAIREIKIDDSISIDVGPLNDELDKLTTELTITRSDLKELTTKVDNLNDKISEYTDENISDRIKQQVIKVIADTAKKNLG